MNSGFNDDIAGDALNITNKTIIFDTGRKVLNVPR